MAYDRYDSRRGSGGPPRYPNDPYGEREGRGRGEREERGFFERAGDQIASWFGDEDDDDRNYTSDRSGFRSRERERERGGRDQGGWRSSPQPQGWGTRVPADRDYERADRDFDERSERGSYRPLAGDYARSEGSAGGYGRSGSSQWPGGGSDRYEGPWSRDDYRRSSFAGSAERWPERGSQRGQSLDPHYQQWRQRQIEELDRDYDEYRREHQSKFEHDFGSWRSNRQTKRQLLGQIREHMDVVGSDDQPVGTVDKVARDRIILTKLDEAADGVHHSLSCTEIDRIEGDKVILSSTAEEARNRWREEGRDRAMFEREGGSERDSGDGPHILDRSFSGTYR